MIELWQFIVHGRVVLGHIKVHCLLDVSIST